MDWTDGHGSTTLVSFIIKALLMHHVGSLSEATCDGSMWHGVEVLAMAWFDAGIEP